MTTCTAEEGCTADAVTMKLCNKHYKRTRPRTPDVMVDMVCDCCGTTFKRARRSKARYARAYCSTLCRDYDAYGPLAHNLPVTHWARWYGAASEWTAPERQGVTFQCGACADCGAGIVEPAGQTPSVYCGRRCTKRSAKRRRRAREHGATGEFRWSQLMAQHMRQGRRCAYCGELTENPDPEHVVPLSRGGRNDMSNLVTACRACNTDKGDMTPAEWSADRAHRGKPALNTDLQGTAFTHLWIREPMNEAWRHRKAA